jgi:hypothetical protein
MYKNRNMIFLDGIFKKISFGVLTMDRLDKDGYGVDMSIDRYT